MNLPRMTSPAADVYQGPNLVAHLIRTTTRTSLSYLPEGKLERGMLATTLIPKSDPIESTD